MQRVSSNGAFVNAYAVGGQPIDITADYANQLVWYAARKTATSQQIVGSVSMQGAVNEYVVPSTFNGNLFGITMGPDNNVWFVGAGNKIGRMTHTGDFTIYNLPGGASALWRITPGLDGNLWATSLSNIAKITPAGSITLYPTARSNERTIGITAGSDGNMWFTEYDNNKIAKIGTGVTTTATDNDGDALNVSQEFAQGTSDLSIDTDGDGLSDFTESTSFPNRNDVFCNTASNYCEYPNPKKRDLYIEADWMTKPGASGYSMQPNTSQANQLKMVFQNKGIDVHFDIGQLGGGNEIPYNDDISFAPTLGYADFYDYKVGGDGISRQFNQQRYHIFHYMLFGNAYTSSDGVSLNSGVSYGGDDDTFIAFGLVTQGQTGASADLAIASTVVHELGHTVCLTNPSDAYADQPTYCQFNGIDRKAGSGYPSAENYSYAFGLADFSTGQTGTSDHDDWSAIRLSDFAYRDVGDPGYTIGLLSTNSKLKIKSKADKPKAIDGVPIRHLKKDSL